MLFCLFVCSFIYIIYIDVEEKVAEKRGRLSASVAGDLSQNPNKIFRGGPWLPTVARSSEMAMFSCAGDREGHFFTQRELAFSQGWPSIPEIGGGKYDACIGYDLHSLSRRAQTSLQGNGMHLASISSFMLFFFSQMLRRDVASEFLPPLRILKGPDRQNVEGNPASLPEG